MRRKKRAAFVCLTFLIVSIICFGCLDPFTPDIPGDENNILIVEGFVRAGQGKSVFKLSRMSPLDNQKVRRVTNAIVTIVSSGGQHYVVPEISDGVYETAELTLPVDEEYELSVALSDGSRYVSERQHVKVTPPIDSVHWKWTSSLEIYFSTHDPAANTRYYQWEFEETWQIRSPFKSYYKWENDTIVARTDEERKQMLDCWRTLLSSDVLIHSTKGFTLDAAEIKIKSLPQSSDRTETRYSILVKLHTLTAEHFNYLTAIRNNSNQVGSYFDPLPSEIHGNVRNINNPDEIVVGYIGAYTEVSKRLFIDNKELPPAPMQYRCDTKSGTYMDDTSVLGDLLASYWTPIGGAKDPITGETTLVFMETYCLDCRLRGSPIKPDFWE